MWMWQKLCRWNIKAFDYIKRKKIEMSNIYEGAKQKF